MVLNKHKRIGGMSALPTANALELATAAITRGDVGEGKAALQQILEREPNNAAAWYWMGFCQQDVQARDACFQRVRQRSKRPGFHPG